MFKSISNMIFKIENQLITMSLSSSNSLTSSTEFTLLKQNKKKDISF